MSEMAMDQLDRLLKNRHTSWLEWSEPWPGRDKEYNTLDAHVVMRATVHDCVNIMRRFVGRAAGDLPDRELLRDFVMRNWAMEVADA